MSLFVSILLALVSGPHCGGGAVRQLYRDSRHQIQNTGYNDTSDNHICRDIAPVDTALCAVMGIICLQLVKMPTLQQFGLPMLTLAQQGQTLK